MDTKVVIGVIAVIVIGLGAYGISSNNKEAAMMEQKAMEEKTMMEEKAMMEKKAMEEKAMMEKEAGAMEADKMMEKDGAMMEKKDGSMMSKGSYEMYDASKLAMAKDGKVVLFFKASWCPTCRTLDADIKASLADIPAGVTILEVDYDKYGDLKQKYGVTMQHTLVQVDASGNQIMKWSGGATLEDVVKNIK
jgi:thiol-disulfide isomerase/thioredoxin